MIRKHLINEDNDLMGILSIRAINTLKVLSRKDLEERREEILQNIKKTGGRRYGKKTSYEVLRYFNVDPAQYIEDWEEFKKRINIRG